LTDCEASFIKKHVVDDGCSHDELIKILSPKTCLENCQ
jgi:hypothetical protein